MTDTIVALSSGAPPAAIAVMRISGPAAFEAAERLCGKLPRPRHASLRKLRDHDGDLLDNALVLLFPGPSSVTGEDLAELHLHGGRAVVRAVERALLAVPGVRVAEPGEFTRRSLIAGRIDLTEAEGLADLLAAETDAQRQAALRAAEGGFRARIEEWTRRTVALAALVEAVIDHEEEDDVGDADTLLDRVRHDAVVLADDIDALLASPPAERLRDGIRVVLAGPPNSGKSTLFNALVARDAAIVSPIAGTTRDRIEAPVLRNGVAWLFIDTAGLAEHTSDPIEAIGIERSRESVAQADMVLWLGDTASPDDGAILVHSRMDEAGRDAIPPGRVGVAAGDERSLSALWSALDLRAQTLLPQSDQLLLNTRQREVCRGAALALRDAATTADPLFIAEHLRFARGAYDRLTGRADTENVLDALFAGFCVGK
ncbi:tRNA uridine-5-carboxymethylaminomethyl(34) synthesis GTPase MnmE [Sphingomonas sp. RS2018]